MAKPEQVQYALTFKDLESLVLFVAGSMPHEYGRDIYQWLKEEKFAVDSDDYPWVKEYAQAAKEAYDDV